MNSLTIAIPTYNRAPMLERTLASIAAVRIPARMTAEVLVIDNNSRDATGEVVRRFAEESPFPVRYAIEGNAGSSYARNRAVMEARGDVILFIDDDALAEPPWAEELVGAIERRRLDVACGIVVPRWMSPPPRWMGPRLYPKLAVHDEQKLAASTSRENENIHNYFSANVAFRRRTFDLFGNFREDLGVVGGNPMSGEDTELFERIIASGGAIGFVLTARVHHMIPLERMKRSYLRRKSFAFGFGSAINGGPTHNHLEKLGRNAIRMVAALARGDRERAVYHELECANFLGYWRGRLHLNRQRGDT